MVEFNFSGAPALQLPGSGGMDFGGTQGAFAAITATMNAVQERRAARDRQRESIAHDLRMLALQEDSQKRMAEYRQRLDLEGRAIAEAEEGKARAEAAKIQETVYKDVVKLYKENVEERKVRKAEFHPLGQIALAFTGDEEGGTLALAKAMGADQITARAAYRDLMSTQLVKVFPEEVAHEGMGAFTAVGFSPSEAAKILDTIGGASYAGERHLREDLGKQLVAQYGDILETKRGPAVTNINVNTAATEGMSNAMVGNLLGNMQSGSFKPMPMTNDLLFPGAKESQDPRAAFKMDRMKGATIVPRVVGGKITFDLVGDNLDADWERRQEEHLNAQDTWQSMVSRLAGGGTGESAASKTAASKLWLATEGQPATAPQAAPVEAAPEPTPLDSLLKDLEAAGIKTGP